MTDPTDKLFDEYLKRDSVVSQRFREIEVDEVPPELDAEVLAEARAATATQRKLKPAWMKWSAPLALAASAVLIVAIVLEVGVQEAVRIPAAQQEQTSTISQPTPEAEVVQEVIQVAPVAAPTQQMQFDAPASAADETTKKSEVAPPETAKKSAEREAIESVVVTRSPPQPVVQDAPLSDNADRHDQLAGIASDSGSRTDSRAGSVAQSTARDRASEEFTVTANARAESRQRTAPVPPRAVSIMTTAAPAPSAQQAPRLAPEDWLEQIRTLRREGKVLEADEQWEEFSEAYPNFAVAETDSARPKP